MRRYSSRKSLLVFLAATFLFSFIKPPLKADFSGSWSLNEGKSELGDFARFTTRKIKAEQKEDGIVISKTTPSFQGGDDVTTTETLTFDGKVSESTVFGSAKKKSTIKWSDDGNSLAITYTIVIEGNGESFDINGKETWTLAGDGKSMTVDIEASSTRGDRKSKAVYDKG